MCDLRYPVLPEVLLAADEEIGGLGAEVPDLRQPLLGDVLEGIGVVNGKADKHTVRSGVGQRAEAVEVLLSCRVPQGEFYRPDNQS